LSIPIPAVILDKLAPAKLFARLNIASKILLGYMTLVGLTVIVVVYALVSLQRINSLNRSIVNVDIFAQEAADKMVDAVLAQETFEKRYLVLRSDDMRSLFARRGDEFSAWLSSLKALPDRSGLPVETIDALHAKLTELFHRETQLVRAKKIGAAYAISNGELENVFEHLLDTLRNMSLAAKKTQDQKMKQISGVGGTAFFTTAILWTFSNILGAVAGLVVTHHISSSINALKVGTEHIAEGHFDFDPKIETADEIGGLAQAFIAMGRRLRKLEEMYLDASPLTRLPGGIAIENVLKKRMESRQPLAFCVLDIDNFKAFNDRYGYAHGSEVIKETAHIIEDAVKLKGTPEDFIGHVGGDDFVVVTVPDYMREISTEILTQFDKRIPEFYAPEDRRRGYILGRTRQGVEMEFPIMTISIAIVTNQGRKFTNPLEASEMAAELKDYAKTIPKSVFVVDRRRGV
jgi:GGDEF domain-containing protein/CHASE3 domain sensor protein